MSDRTPITGKARTGALGSLAGIAILVPGALGATAY